MEAECRGPAARVAVVLQPGADPLARAGSIGRDADYRLKLALKVLRRSFGLRCIAARNAGSADPCPLP